MNFDDWINYAQRSDTMPADPNDPLWQMLVDWANDRHSLERRLRSLERALHGIRLLTASPAPGGETP